MGAVCPFLETDGDDTMRKAAEKLKNRRGASLMVALLLFLVCAVVGSAVLVAGTAASGRMSKIAETDRRYYSVNSAAGLLIDLLDGKTVTIKETAVASGAKTYEVKADDGDYTPLASPPAFTSLPLEIAYRIAGNMAGTLPLEDSLTLKLESDGAPASLSAALDATNIRETIAQDGGLKYVVSSGKYALALEFAAEKREARSVSGTTTVTETSITWKLSDVK